MAELMRQLLLEKVPPPKVALPPPPADRRNLEGTWIANQLSQLRYTTGMDGKPLALTPEAQRLLDRRVKATYQEHEPYGNAAAYCLPPGMPWMSGLIYPFQIYQTGDAVIFVFSEYHMVWNVRLNASHRSDGAREFMGDSVAHWDGDTLVVDTVNFKQPLWIDPDGSPTSADAHVTFRIRRTGKAGDLMEMVVTIDDPKMYREPWSFAHTYAWRPDMEFFNEYDCETQLSGPDALARFGLRPEPKP